MTEVYPEKDLVYRALTSVPFEEVKVVVIGQDPNHNPGQSNGFAFAVNNGFKAPPSLSNIKKEVELTFGCSLSVTDVTLEGWAEQGVLLLNTSLTVEKGSPGSHSQAGWDVLVDSVITALSESGRPMVFILWGDSAISKTRLINRFKPNYILESGHPSPSSVKLFLGREHLKLANAFLVSSKISPIDWTRIETRKESLRDRLFGTAN